MNKSSGSAAKKMSTTPTGDNESTPKFDKMKIRLGPIKTYTGDDGERIDIASVQGAESV